MRAKRSNLFFKDLIPMVKSCPLCGSWKIEPHYRKKGKNIYRCSVCAGGFVHPLPSIEECVMYYDSEYVNGRYRHRLTPPAEELKVQTCRMRVKVMEGYFSSPGKVLDVGCSSGTFLSVMESEGWDIYGVDISQESCRSARERWKERIRVLSLENLAGDQKYWARGSFDLITMFDTLEHSPDPRRLLKEARRLLRAWGLLVITTHNFSSYASKLMGRWWSYLDPLEHLFYFSPKTLSALMRAEGYSGVDLKSSGKFVNMAFLLGECKYSNPFIFRLLSPVLRTIVPGPVLRYPFFLPMGEIIAFGRKSTKLE